MNKIQAMNSIVTILINGRHNNTLPSLIMQDLHVIPIKILHTIQEETAQAIDEINTTDDEPA